MSKKLWSVHRLGMCSKMYDVVHSLGKNHWGRQWFGLLYSIQKFHNGNIQIYLQCLASSHVIDPLNADYYSVAVIATWSVMSVWSLADWPVMNSAIAVKIICKFDSWI